MCVPCWSLVVSDLTRSPVNYPWNKCCVPMCNPFILHRYTQCAIPVLHRDTALGVLESEDTLAKEMQKAPLTCCVSKDLQAKGQSDPPFAAHADSPPPIHSLVPGLCEQQPKGTRCDDAHPGEGECESRGALPVRSRACGGLLARSPLSPARG